MSARSAPCQCEKQALRPRPSAKLGTIQLAWDGKRCEPRQWNRAKAGQQASNDVVSFATCHVARRTPGVASHAARRALRGMPRVEWHVGGRTHRVHR